MEMCAVGLPPPSPAGSAHPRRPCPQLDALRKPLAQCRVGGGSVKRAGVTLTGVHGALEVKWPDWGEAGAGLWLERGRMRRKKKRAGLGSSGVSLAPSRIDCEGERRPGSVLLTPRPFEVQKVSFC